MAEESKRVLMMDGRTRVSVNTEEFEIIKMMVEDAGGKDSLAKIPEVIDDLISQGYDTSRAKELCLLARGELLEG